MSLNALWHTIQAGIASLGAWLAAYLGGLDGLVYALIVFAIADYITGVLAAINERRVSSAVGFRGISLIENATRLGLPIPAQMRDALDAIANRADKRPPLTNTDPTETHTDKEQR